MDNEHEGVAPKTMDMTHMSDLVQAYRDIRAEIKAKEEELALVRERIEKEMGWTQIGKIDGAEVVTWKYRKVSRLDSKALAKVHPDVYKEFVTETSQRYFVVKP